MSQATTSDDGEPNDDINEAVVRQMANSDRPSAWIYERYLEFYDEEDA